MTSSQMKYPVTEQVQQSTAMMYLPFKVGCSFWPYFPPLEIHLSGCGEHFNHTVSVSVDLQKLHGHLTLAQRIAVSLRIQRILEDIPMGKTHFHPFHSMSNESTVKHIKDEKLHKKICTSQHMAFKILNVNIVLKHMWGSNNEIRLAVFRLFTIYFIALKEIIRSQFKCDQLFLSLIVNGGCMYFSWKRIAHYNEKSEGQIM